MNDHESIMDVTSWSLTVKRTADIPWNIKGELVNIFVAKAFDETDLDNKAAIETIKHELWYAFRKCYLKDI